MRRIITAVLFLAAAVSAQPAPKADDVAKHAIQSLAGSAWEKARYIAFTFDVERDGKIVASFPQRWDRYTGDYRVSGKNREGKDILVIMNINTKQGKAWVDGVEVADPKDQLTFGYRRFINDTYWLLMGFKTFDPGVTREYAGEKKNDAGQDYDLVKLSFSNVGLTPGDQYWMWVNRKTGLVDEWDMKLEGSKPEDEPQAVIFYDYKNFGGLNISTKREIKGKNQFIKLDDITVSQTVPADAFVK
jgi:hypothetical protein